MVEHHMKVHLLTFPDCPNAASARAHLRQALRDERVDTPFVEIDISRPDTDPALRA